MLQVFGSQAEDVRDFVSWDMTADPHDEFFAVFFDKLQKSDRRLLEKCALKGQRMAYFGAPHLGRGKFPLPTHMITDMEKKRLGSLGWEKEWCGCHVLSPLLMIDRHRLGGPYVHSGQQKGLPRSNQEKRHYRELAYAGNWVSDRSRVPHRHLRWWDCKDADALRTANNQLLWEEANQINQSCKGQSLPSTPTETAIYWRRKLKAQRAAEGEQRDHMDARPYRRHPYKSKTTVDRGWETVSPPTTSPAQRISSLAEESVSISIDESELSVLLPNNIT